MSGISTGAGLFSGIDTASIIGQLMAIESRPKVLAQSRMSQLKLQQAAYLDINSRLNALKTLGAAFRTSKTFDTKQATSSNTSVLTATAGTAAAEGTYTFIVDRLVSTQQLLSGGFSDKDATGIGASSFTFETALGRLDRETSLADLNAGAGVARGKIVITDSTGGSATVDLSKASTVQDVLDAINSATGIDATATVEGNHFVVDHDGAGTLTIQSAAGYTTAESLGIATGSATATVTGSSVYALASGTSLRALNDGNGVFVNDTVGTGNYDFTITVGSTGVNVNLGNIYDAQFQVQESAVTTVGGALERINEALQAALGDTSVQATISGNRLVITDSLARTVAVTERAGGSTTATDLGILGSSASGILSGKSILAGMNSTLARTLNGGDGVAGSGSISITARDGSIHTVSVDVNASLDAVLREFSADTGGKVRAAINETGTGILVTDTTGGVGNLVISGTTAESLNIDTTGTASSTLDSGSLQHAYVTSSTLLSALNEGKGIGTGTFRIIDSMGRVETFEIGSDTDTVGELISEINGRTTSRARARINSGGDGIEIYEEVPGGQGEGASKIKVEDVSGIVAKGLRIAGEAAGVGAQNTIDGSYETEVEFEVTDTLEDVARKVNEAGIGVTASVINDGSSATPYRLSLVSRSSGTAGRFTVGTGGLALGLSSLDKGNDARVIFGSSDPARGVMLTSSSNTLDEVVAGVTIDLTGTDDDAVQLSVTRDTAQVESKVKEFLDAFNDLVDRIDFQSRYDQETDTRGALLGDGTLISLRSGLFSTMQGEALNVGGTFTRLADVGVEVGDGGELVLDVDRFREALNEDPDGVEALFAARVLDPDSGETDLGDNITVDDPNARESFLSLGVAGQMEELARRYLDSIDGVLTQRNKALDTQIKLQESRIADFDVRLATRRQVLERQFLAMEQAIMRLQSQQSALGVLSR